MTFVGSDEEISIEDLADSIIEITKSKSQKKFISYKQAYGKPFDDMLRRLPALNRIRNTIGFKPKKNLTQILEIIVNSINL